MLTEEESEPPSDPTQGRGCRRSGPEARGSEGTWGQGRPGSRGPVPGGTPCSMPGRSCKDTGFDCGTGWRVVSTRSASSERAAAGGGFLVAPCHMSMPQSLRGCSEGPLQAFP